MPDAGDGSAAPGSARPDRARRSPGRPVLWAGLIGLLAGGVLAAAVALTDWPRADAARGVHAAGRRMLALEHVRIDTTDFSVGDRAWFVYQAPDRLDMHIHSRGRWTRLLRIGRIGYRQLPGETTFQRRVLYLLASPVPRNFFRGIATATRVRRRGSLYLFDVEAPYLASSLVEARLSNGFVVEMVLCPQGCARGKRYHYSFSEFGSAPPVTTPPPSIVVIPPGSGDGWDWFG